MQPGAREYDTVMETRRANVHEALRIVNRAGGQPPQSGDELLDSGSTMAFHEEIDQLIRNAITKKHLLRFTHKNQGIAEPQDYGIQNGIIVLLSSRRAKQQQLPGWRLVDVSEIHDCEMMKQRFAGNREAASRKHHRWDEIFIRVAPPAKA